MEVEPAGKEASVSITENSVADELDASNVRPRRSRRLHKVPLPVTDSCPLGNLLSIFMSYYLSFSVFIYIFYRRRIKRNIRFFKEN